MNIEYEATFPNINKTQIRSKLKKAGAKLARPEFVQKSLVFNLPNGRIVEGSWLRVRDEGNGKITMSFKIVAETNKIEDQTEVCLEVDNLKNAADFLECLGCEQIAFQEKKRELWQIKKVEICIDEWPFLEPFVEIEGDTETAVKKAAEKLGFDYKKARFCSADFLYAEKYGISLGRINNKTPKIIFKGPNPFLK